MRLCSPKILCIERVSLAVLALPALSVALAGAEIKLPADAEDCVRWAAGDVRTATVALTHEDLMFLVEAQDKAGRAENFPPLFEQTPCLVVPPFAENP